jgi:hypothetical protein
MSRRAEAKRKGQANENKGEDARISVSKVSPLHNQVEENWPTLEGSRRTRLECLPLPWRSVAAQEAAEGFVTLITVGQFFGLKIKQARDVFVPHGLSSVPLAPAELAGLFNLRRRVVTAIDLRRPLGLPPRELGRALLAVGREARRATWPRGRAHGRA